MQIQAGSIGVITQEAQEEAKFTNIQIIVSSQALSW
jgi:hypothetical protein